MSAPQIIWKFYWTRKPKWLGTPGSAHRPMPCGPGPALPGSSTTFGSCTLVSFRLCIPNMVTLVSGLSSPQECCKNKMS